MKHPSKILPLLLALLLSLSACGALPAASNGAQSVQSSVAASAPADSASDDSSTATPDGIPAYAGAAYAAVNDNIPYFTDEDKQRTDPFETYSDLDELGRCGVAYANICTELMPTEERGEIGQVKPSGWKTAKYDCVEGKYLYNRCHLIGFQLAGENANEKNLITGTRYLNIQGMLPFENLVADYVKETNNHVLYRVAPMFDGDNLVASGVLMEGWSVEDGGEGVCFCVYAYNVQPGVSIDYATGDSELAETADADNTDSTGSSTDSSDEQEYVLNISSHKFHRPDCSGAATISAANRQEYVGSRASLIAEGYEPCGRCKP